jgi:hypothetical protein
LRTFLLVQAQGHHRLPLPDGCLGGYQDQTDKTTYVLYRGILSQNLRDD